MTNVLTTINFHGNDLYLVEHQNEPFAPMKPIIEGMGLDWKSQHKKMTDNRERWGVVIITIPVAGQHQQAVCMPLRKLPAFFASISVNKVRPELRAKIILFQNECDDALWRYWSEKKSRGQIEAEPAPTLPEAPITPDQQCTLQNMVRGLVDKGGIYANIWSRFNNHFRLAKYSQLPQSRMSEAVAYLMSMDVQPQALREASDMLPASISAPRPIDTRITGHFSMMKHFIDMALMEERQLYSLLRETCWTDARSNDTRKHVLVYLWETLDDLSYSLDKTLNAMQNHTRAIVRVKNL